MEGKKKEEKKKKKMNDAKFNGHYVRQHTNNISAHALLSDQLFFIVTIFSKCPNISEILQPILPYIVAF